MKKFKFVCFLLILEVFLNLLPSSGIAEIYTEAGVVSSDVPFDPFYGYTPIYTKQDLDNVRNDLNGQYYLANDIAFEAADFAEGGEFYNGGNGWLPIGYAVIVNGVMAEDKPFTGTFDGCNHSVKGLKMNPSGSGVFTAMFAYNTGKIYRLDLEAELFYSNTTKSDIERRHISLLCVKNWGVIESCSTSGKLEARILAEDVFNDTVNAGAIASYNYGTIKKCSNSAEMIFSVPADAAWTEYPIRAAGICEENQRIITDCFNSGNITSNNYSSGYKNISGIVGSNYGITRNTINTGKIKNDGHGYPIIRYNSGSADVICENNVFLSDEEYLNSMPFLPGTKETSIAQMMQSSTYEGWDFSGIWEIDEGVSLPRLRIDPRNLLPELYDYSLGNGTQDSPYVITDAKEFMHINDYPAGCFRLDADIVLTNENAYVTAEFKGMLDGNGYSLNNMFPLFKFNYGTISDLYIDDAQFEIPEGQNYFGGFVSTNNGCIENCHISGSITGLASIYTNTKQVEIGGISASNFGVIRQCSSDVNISVFFEEYKENYIGGITGRNDGHIIECRSDANIIVGDCYYSARVGGIAGLNQVNVTAYDNPRGLIERCYYSGDIIGFKDGSLTSSSYYGGIAGESGSLFRSEYGQAYIKNCYFIGTISVIASYDTTDTPYNSGAYAGGIAGLNNTYSAIVNCYAAGAVEGISDNDANPVRAGAGLGDCKGTASFTAADFGIRGIYDNYMNGSVNMCSPEEMRSSDAYNGFDFVNVWEFINQEEFCYPVLKGVELLYTKKPVTAAITQLPSKLTFAEDGDFDFSGMVVSCTYNNGLSEPTEMYEIYYYDPLVYGANEFFVSYDDGYYMYYDIFDVEIVPKAFASITMNDMPYIQNYFTNSLVDASGGTITINYADSTQKVIDITEDMINQKLLSAEGVKSVNVSFYGKSTSFEVNVFSRSIQSSIFRIDGNNSCIEGVQQGTKVSELISGIKQKDFVVVQQDGQIASSGTILKTGSELVMYDYFYNQIDMLYIIVSGDINGDGAVTISDMLAVKAHLLKKNELNTMFAQAGDTNGDGSISITDFIQIKARLLGKK